MLRRVIIKQLLLKEANGQNKFIKLIKEKMAKKPKHIDSKDKKNKNKTRVTGMSYEEERELQTQKRVKIFAWGLLVIMGLTLISWSMLGYGGNTSENGGDIPFTQGLYQNPQTGEVFDGARIDGVDFIFFIDITPYVNDEMLIEVSSALLQTNSSIIYEIVDETFQNDDARFLVNQGLQANDKFTSINEDNNCTEPTIVYTTLDSNTTYSNNCIIFQTNVTEAFSLANGLTYHLIKDIS